MHGTVDVLKKLRHKYKNKNKQIVLFWDNAGWHKGSVVQKFIEEDGNIEIIWFHKYAPDLNPQEQVWKKGRGAVTHNRYIKDIDAATDELVKFFNKTKPRIPSWEKGLFYSVGYIYYKANLLNGSKPNFAIKSFL